MDYTFIVSVCPENCKQNPEPRPGQNPKTSWNSKEDLAVIAVPSYAGRVPAVAVQRLAAVKGNGARAVLVCVYGNRAYEDTLVELADTAKEAGFRVMAAVSAIAEHSIARQFAAGRPDAEDAQRLAGALGFAPGLEKCGRCGGSLENGGLFAVDEGMVLCPRCRVQRQDLRLSETGRRGSLPLDRSRT